MLLYTNQNGNWAGNLIDAKKMDGKIIKKNVPKDKPNVLKFLNENKVGLIKSNSHEIKTDAQSTNQATRNIATHRESAWHNINRVAEEAPLSELITAMNIIMLRIQDEYERKE